jgi:hypothetical protein
MNQGFIALRRDFTQWEWYTDIPTKTLFIHLLLKVNHTEGKWKGEVVPKDHHISSLSKLSLETGLTIKQIRIALKKLVDSGYVGTKKTRLNTYISIPNIELFINEGTERAQKGHEKGKERATNNNDNNENNEREDVDKSTTPKTSHERKIEFGQKVKVYSNKYPEPMLRDFFYYWTERNEKGQKMRFEMEKVFDIKRRLATWNSRQKTFTKKPEAQIDPLVEHVRKMTGK